MSSTRKRRFATEREESVARMSARIEGQQGKHWPRMTMLMVVSIAAGAGFLSSAVMLWMGMRYMPLRYALAGLAGYGTFLFLMNQWLGRHLRQSLVENAIDLDSALDVSGAVLRSGSRAAGRTADGFFKGGRSGGGGASASFNGAGAPVPIQPLPLVVDTSSGGSGSKGFSLDLDDADDMLPVMAVVAIAIGIAASASVIWQAPQMMAELLVDGAAAGTAYRALRPFGTWTPDVMRRTMLPAAIIIGVFVLLGIAGHQLKPGADSIGDFLM